jgi:phosphatidylglycerophosphate synthase
MFHFSKSQFNIPNLLSVVRIPLSIFIIPYGESKAILLALFIACALTDFLDGYIARKYKLESRTGAYLDSFADFVFFSAVILYLFIHQKEIIYNNGFLLISIVTVRILSLIICYWRNKRFYILHTIGNKTSGFFIFLFICINIFIPLHSFVFFLLLYVLLCAAEEMTIMIFIKSPDVNIKRLYFNRHR